MRLEEVLGYIPKEELGKLVIEYKVDYLLGKEISRRNDVSATAIFNIKY